MVHTCENGFYTQPNNWVFEHAGRLESRKQAQSCCGVSLGWNIEIVHLCLCAGVSTVWRAHLVRDQRLWGFLLCRRTALLRKDTGACASLYIYVCVCVSATNSILIPNLICWEKERKRKRDAGTREVKKKKPTERGRLRMRNRSAFRNETSEEWGKRGREEINAGFARFLLDNIQLDFCFLSALNPALRQLVEKKIRYLLRWDGTH